MTCRQCHRPAHPGTCSGSLLPELPPWKLELQERIAAHRQRARSLRAPDEFPRLRAASAETLPQCEADEGAEWQPVLAGRDQPPSDYSESAQPTAPLSHAASAPAAACSAVAYHLADPVPQSAPRAVAAKVLDFPAVPATPLHRKPEAESHYLQIPLPITATADENPLPAAQVASNRARLHAALFDIGIILLASVAFAVAAWFSQGGTALTPRELHLLRPALALVPVMLATLYVLASFYFCGRTPGMARQRLEVAGLAGEADIRVIRHRAWASLISLYALGLGYMWIWCDPQRLTWHDYISKTYVREAAPPVPPA